MHDPIRVDPIRVDLPSVRPALPSVRRRLAATLLAALLAGVVGCGAAQRPGGQLSADGNAPWHALPYPPAPRGAQQDNYHGTTIADPYRWLEDPDTSASRAWIEAQNKLTRSVLGGIAGRAAIRRSLERVWNYPRTSPPSRKGDRYFFYRNDGLQPQPVFYWADALGKDAASTKTHVLIDPNTLSGDGTVAVKDVSINQDGTLAAVQVSSGGSDFTEFRVIDVATGRTFDERLQWAKFTSATWAPGGRSFWYSRYDAPKAGAGEGDALRAVNAHQKLYLHRVGTPQRDDVLVYEAPTHPDWGFGATLSDDDAWLIVSVWKGAIAKTQVFLQPLTDSARALARRLERRGATLDKHGMLWLREGFDARYDYITNNGDRFLFLTDRAAPRGRVVAIELGSAFTGARVLRRPDKDAPPPEPAGWSTVIAEQDAALRGVRCVGDRLITHRLRDARSEVTVHRLDGTAEGAVKLPGLGRAYGFSGQRGHDASFIGFTSFLSPGRVLRLDVATRQLHAWHNPTLAVDTAGYETRQIFATNPRDGTRVPAFIVGRKGLTPTGDHPVLLHAYGGFSVALTPTFRPSVLAWLEMGGVYVMANLRGGGEYGEAWHQAGMLERKQNVFDDFIAVAEHLVATKLTRPERMAMMGGSNGGLLVGAVMTQRPELFGAALPAVGVMDMLRFHRFTIGWAWVPEYGSSDDPRQFETLLRYSPLHNLRPGTRYPATLVTTADHDDRVVPAHSFKFAATLQHAQARAPDAPPTLIRVETRAGHGAGKPTAKRIDEAADKWAFLARALGMTLPPELGAAPTGGGR